MVRGTNHKEILCSFSTESQCDLQGANHSNNQRYEDHVGKYLQGVPLAYPMSHHFLLQQPSFHVVDTCNPKTL